MPTLLRIFDRKYDVRPFPDHCVARPRKEAIRIRLRIPAEVA